MLIVITILVPPTGLLKAVIRQAITKQHQSLKATMNFSTVIFLMTSRLIYAAIPECSSVEENVACSLEANYDKNVPPATTGNQPVPINVGIELRQISDIDEEKHTITLVAYIGLSWVDPRLNSPAVTLPMGQVLNIWMPETYFQNSVKVKSILSG